MEFSLQAQQRKFRTVDFFQYEEKIEKCLWQEVPANSYTETSELRLSSLPLQNHSESLNQHNRTIFEIKMNDSAIASISARLIPNSCEVPLENSSQDLFYHCHIFSRLRMDQVYMICSEARRIVRQNGIWAMIDHAPGNNFLTNLSAKAWEKVLAHRNMELTHYISPEDWGIIVDKKISLLGITSQILILQRV